MKIVHLLGWVAKFAVFLGYRHAWRVVDRAVYALGVRLSLS